MASTAPAAFLPIAELSAYQSKWTIKARVTNKADIRKFKNGNGQVLNVTLLDSMGGEIRASFFNQAVDKYGTMLQTGKCYSFSKGSVRVANKQYNPTSHRYELTFDDKAEVATAEDDKDIEAVKFNITTLKAMTQKTLPCQIDLCGVVASFQEIATVQSKEGQALQKRDITFADDSGMSMRVTLWGDKATQDDKNFANNALVALKSVLVKEWRDTKQGSILASGMVQFSPTFPEAQRVQQWWKQGGSTQTLVDLSKGDPTAAAEGGGVARNATPTTIGGLQRAAQRLTGTQPEVFSIHARLSLVQTRKQGEIQPLHYMACQEPREGTRGLMCQKRVESGSFCPSCNRTVKSAPRLNIRCCFVDVQDQAWLTSFHESATKILGMSAEEVKTLETAAAEKGEGGREEFDQAIKKLYFNQPLNLLVRAKLDTYNGEMRPNISIIGANPVSMRDHARVMLKEIHEGLTLFSQAGA